MRTKGMNNTEICLSQNLRDIGIGVELISKILEHNYDKQISHTTIAKYTKGFRTFDKRHEVKHITYKPELRNKAIWFVDGWRATNKGYKHGHHKRAYLKGFNRYIVFASRFKVLDFIELKSKEEKELTFKILLERNIKHMNKGDVILMDRYYKGLTQVMEQLGFRVCVAGKTHKQPYNTEIEQCFSNIGKTLRELLKQKRFKWLKSSPKEIKRTLTHAYLMAYWFYDDTELQEIVKSEQLIQKQQIKVVVNTR